MVNIIDLIRLIKFFGALQLTLKKINLGGSTSKNPLELIKKLWLQSASSWPSGASGFLGSSISFSYIGGFGLFRWMENKILKKYCRRFIIYKILSNSFLEHFATWLPSGTCISHFGQSRNTSRFMRQDFSIKWRGEKIRSC